jgi:uncharacterized membrane protein
MEYLQEQDWLGCSAFSVNIYKNKKGMLFSILSGISTSTRWVRLFSILSGISTRKRWIW